MNGMDPGTLAITGIGEVPAGWYPQKSCIELAVEAVKSALRDAGIPKQEIGAFFLVPPLARERDEYHMTFCRLQEEMGIHGSAKLNMQVASWGASPILAIETAGTLIRNGEIASAIIYNAQNFSGASEQDLHWFFERNNRGFHREWERHFGISQESMAALITRRYMHETNTTEAELAEVTVSLRKWARLNEFARNSNAVSIAAVLGSEMKSTPMHSMECGNLSDGATAIVVTGAQRAREVSSRLPVFVLGSGHSGPPCFSFVQKPDGDFTRLGFGVAAAAALTSAGREIGEVDLFELYAPYPIFYLLQLEELGLCERGRAGDFFRSSMCAPGGKHPVATNGGIQQGNTGLGVAMATITESVRQLRSEAGARQVKNAKTALISGFGNQMLDSHALVLGIGANT